MVVLTNLYMGHTDGDMTFLALKDVRTVLLCVCVCVCVSGRADSYMGHDVLDETETETQKHL